jgi:hypothetical protein
VEKDGAEPVEPESMFFSFILPVPVPFSFFLPPSFLPSFLNIFPSPSLIFSITGPDDRLRRANFDRGQQELVVVAERMFLDMSQEGGVARFFEVVKSTPKLSDLPPMYPFFICLILL